MENENELEELSVQELANISGGILYVSKPDNKPIPVEADGGNGSSQTDNLWPECETVTKQLEDFFKPSFDNSCLM